MHKRYNLRAPGRPVIWHDCLRPITTALGLAERRPEPFPPAGVLRGYAEAGHSSFGGVLFPVDIATVADSDHLYEQPVVVDFIDNPVVTDTHPVHVRFAHQGNASRRPRFTGEQIDDRPDPLLLVTGYKSERLEGSTSDLDPVAVHTNPRSAFACSQGT